MANESDGSESKWACPLRFAQSDDRDTEGPASGLRAMSHDNGWTPSGLTRAGDGGLKFGETLILLKILPEPGDFFVVTKAILIPYSPVFVSFHGVIFKGGRLAAEIIDTAARDQEEALDASVCGAGSSSREPRKPKDNDSGVEFQCKFCHDTFNNPVRAPCDHTFCKACIEQWLNERRGSKDRKSCYCGRQVSIEELCRDRETERALTTAGLRPAWLELVTVLTSVPWVDECRPINGATKYSPVDPEYNSYPAPRTMLGSLPKEIPGLSQASRNPFRFCIPPPPAASRFLAKQKLAMSRVGHGSDGLKYIETFIEKPLEIGCHLCRRNGRMHGSVAGLSRVGISDPYPYPCNPRVHFRGFYPYGYEPVSNPSHVSARALRYSRTVKTNELAEDFVFARGARECGARTSDDTINDAVVLFLLQLTFRDLSLACRGGEERGSAARRGARTSDD
ncbi:hypothetical protein FB45DRAFT_1002632 [Roridomyces roridus]|uniref:RING-type domain-containing protein n=1 Tax=Roridomyces roridus TaxID=1738132 RepID=A0AAD7FPD3_9AGAR|nr:hypothetical protein FB45DRAFT_1002632 [Roridomyces roridus]